MKMYLQIFLIATIWYGALANPYYVSPAGDDSNTGTLASPWYSIHKAVSNVSAGDTIYVRGGRYTYSATIVLSTSGTATARICIVNYPGEHPVFDFSSMAEADANRGIYLTGDYWHLKGLEIYKAGDNGIKIEGNYNIIEQCEFHHCGDSGLQIGMAKSDTNPGNIASHNLILNCDSHHNFDSRNSGKNADGFACKLHAGPGNIFKGCRSWENSDDGWDLYENEEQVILEDCWTWHNGDPASYGWSGSWNGNGNGFKIGGNSSYGAPHLVIRCIAFDHKYTSGNCKGFDQNDNPLGQTLYNCVAWGCKQNFALSNDLTGNNYHVVKNCVSFQPAPGGKLYSFCTNTIQERNSWNITGVVADSNDFVSLSVELAKAPREADGSLPNNGFARLRPTSDLIDKGIDVGLPFMGTAPDLGAFEFQPVSLVMDGSLPTSVILYPNYPNPFNPVTHFDFEVKKTGHTLLKLYDICGKEIVTLFEGTAEAGRRYTVTLTASGMASGVYKCVLKQEDCLVTRNVVLLK